MPCLYATVVTNNNQKMTSKPSDKVVEQPATNHVWLWQGVLMMSSQSLANTPHMHFPASLYIGLDGAITVSTDTGPLSARAVLVRPNCEQCVDTHGGAVLDLLIDADSAAYRYLEPVLLERDAVALDMEKITALLPRCQEALKGSLDCDSAWQLVEQLLIGFSAYRPERPEFDPRIEAIATELRSNLPVNPDIEALAKQAEVSESRFMHLFKQQYGLPVRQYLLWARLRQAAMLWQTGMMLTDIAAEVGFYDQAHFARTVRRMFDFSPSWLANPNNLQLHNCQCDDR